MVWCQCVGPRIGIRLVAHACKLCHTPATKDAGNNPRPYTPVSDGRIIGRVIRPSIPENNVQACGVFRGYQKQSKAGRDRQ